MNESAEVPATPSAPPTQRSSVGPPQARSTWPTVLGVLGIVLGILGTLGGLWAAIAPWTLNRWLAGADPGSASWAVQERWAILNTIFGVVGLAVAVLLLVAGIALVRRRASAMTLWRVWAVAKIVTGTVGIVFSAMMQNETFAAITAGSASATQPAPPVLPAGVPILLMGCSFIFLLILPVFALIWFARATVRDEVAGWA